MRLRHLSLTLLTTSSAFAIMVACKTLHPSSSGVTSSGHPTGGVRGTELINQMLRTRLLDAAAASTNSFFIEKIAGPDIENLSTFLGRYGAAGSTMQFYGGVQNPFGMLLWHKVDSRFAEGLGGVCAGDGKTATFFNGSQAVLNGSFTPVLKAICNWPQDHAARATAAANLWHSFVGFAAPDEETAFAEFFAADEAFPADATPATRVASMVAAIMLNPHFLLED